MSVWLAVGFLSSPASANDLLVFAAASLKTALDDVVEKYHAETSSRVVVSYAGTGTLAKQIERGAPADIFVSANEAWMGYLAERSLIRIDTRRTLFGNELVLIAGRDNVDDAPTEAASPPILEADWDLDRALAGGRLAIANTDSVPAGLYAKAMLQSLGAWDAVRPSLAQADNVRTALAFVAVGAAPLGIVYASDAQADPRVQVVARIAASDHPPIRYQGAVVEAATKPGDAEAFLAFLTTSQAQDLFVGRGFRPVKGAGPGRQ